MNVIVRKFRGQGQALPLLLLALLVTGCDHDRPVLEQAPPPTQTVQATPPDAASAGSGAATDPVVSTPPDPLIGSSGPNQKPSDPLLAPDPLASADPLKGPVMPTRHSHWLDVEMGQARIIIRLNGIRLGGYAAPGTQDITMRLRSGVNLLTVTYEPRNERSWASVVVTEGETGPTGTLLASFRQAPHADRAAQEQESQTPPPVIIKTMTFTAR